MAWSPTSPAVSRTRRVNTRTASRCSSGSGSARFGSRSAVMSPGSAPRAVSPAVCMATQMWQRFLVATVMTTTSRATGSSVVFSKIVMSLRKPSMSCGDAAMRAMPAGR